MAHNSIRIIVIEPYEAAHERFTVLTKAFGELKLIAIANTAEDGLNLCVRLHPDVVITSLYFVGIDKFSLTRSIRQTCPGTKIIIMSALYQEDDIAAALKAGASRYVPKTATIDEIAEAIRTVAHETD